MERTWFYKYALNKSFVISERIIYNFTDIKTKNYFKQKRKKVFLIKSESLSNLEKIFLTEKECVNEILIKKIFGLIKEKKTDSVLINNVIPKGNLLINNNQFYELKKNKKGNLRINKNRYIITDNNVSLEFIEDKYVQWLNNIKSIEKEYYSKNLGYKIINDDFYAFTKVGKYEIYNPHKKDFHVFPDIELALKLDYDERIIVKGLYVLNSYSHPALPQFKKPLQKICTGDLKANDYYLSLNGSVKEKIKAVLDFGKNVLSKGYTLNAKPYHNLNNPSFKNRGDCFD